MLFNNISGFLSDSIGNNHTNNEGDILKTRKNISKLVPEYDEDNDIPFITGRLDKAIKIFQKNNGLKIDGKMKPAGETERFIFEKLENKPSEIIFGEQYSDQEIGFGTGNSTFVAKKEPTKYPDGAMILVPEREPNRTPKIVTKDNKIQSGIKDISTLLKLVKVDSKYTKILDTASDVLDIPIKNSKDNKYDVASILNKLKQQQAADKKSLEETGTIERDDRTFMMGANKGLEITITRPSASNQQSVSKPLPKQPQTGNNTSSGTVHTIDTFMPRISIDEGEYTTGKTSPNAIDRGGPTNHGINKDTLSQYEGHKKQRKEPLPSNYTNDVKKVDAKLARQIYDELYYKRNKFDKVSDELTAGHLLDSAINIGPKRAGEFLQQSIDEVMGTDLRVTKKGVKIYDGNIGPQTRSAIENADKQGLLIEVNNKMADKRADHYREIAKNDPTQTGYLKGWLARANSYKTPPKPVPKNKP